MPLPLNYSAQDELQKVVQLLSTIPKVLLVSHQRPDGDTLGATVALAIALHSRGVEVVPACIDHVPTRLQFISDLLPAPLRFVQTFNKTDFPCMVIQDAGASHMTGFQNVYTNFLDHSIPFINIDHHASNDFFGTINVVDPKASSATMITYKLIKAMGIPFTKEMAIALMAGIYNDTGGMQHSNTTQETFEIAADLAQFGVKVEDISRPMFKMSTLPQLKLWGHILEQARMNDEQILSSVVTHEDLMKIGAHAGDTGGIIDLLNTVPDSKFSLLLAEDKGMVKGSLRTQREEVNVSDLAAPFGGGGHPKASGFRVQGRLGKEIRWKILPVTADHQQLTQHVIQ
ncbi:DHH family phosphoesterase [Candidatus Gracilibacteria bacterium]|nr:DHH family phosphoesterase [Candidatus Gracilibacteria bacterium]